MERVQGNEWQVWRDLLAEASAAFGPDRRALYRRAVHQLSDSAEALAQQAEYQASLGQDSELIDLLYRRATEIEPNASICTRCGNWLAREGRLAEAEEMLKKAIALDDSCPVALVSLGNLLAFRLGRAAEAQTFYERAIAIHPNGGVSGDYARYAHRFLGDREAARFHYEKALAFDAEEASACAGLARLLVKSGDDLARAEELFSWSLDLRFDWEVAADYADFIAEVKGDRNAAQRQYQDALRIAPQEGGLKARYERFLSATPSG